LNLKIGCGVSRYQFVIDIFYKILLSSATRFVREIKLNLGLIVVCDKKRECFLDIIFHF